MAARNNENAAPSVMQGSGVGNVRCVAARNQEYNSNVVDFQTGLPIDLYRQTWLRRRIPMSQELIKYFAAMAFEGGRR